MDVDTCELPMLFSHERVHMETYEKLCTDFRALSYEYPMTRATSAHAQFPAVKNGFHSFQLLNTPLSFDETEWQESLIHSGGQPHMFCSSNVFPLICEIVAKKLSDLL